LDLASRSFLWPFRLSVPTVAKSTIDQIESRTQEFNRQAESYYVDHPSADHLLSKPYSEPELFPRRQIDIGMITQGLRLWPGDVVLEIGAGSCWLTHVFNLYGCKTIAVDVSATALSLGETLFRRHPGTNWSLEPEFRVYDGYTLPLSDSSVDRIVLYDAFHHIPNHTRILSEARRVLRPNGILAMMEPGRGHATSNASQAESATTGVLEREVIPEQVADLALQCGFKAARVMVSPSLPFVDIDAHRLRSFMGGSGFARYWHALCAQLDGRHHILLFAGAHAWTTARPNLLRADVRIEELPSPFLLAPGQRSRLVLRLRNDGDTTWLSRRDERGWTRLGLHLHRRDASEAAGNVDWVRASLPADVPPGHALRVAVPFAAPADPGPYCLVADLVIEGLTWFQQRGSKPAKAPFEVAL
jgi:SAM-dependent methyltransferase